MEQNIKVSKTVNDTVEGTIRKVLSAIKDLGLELKNVDSKNGIIRFEKYTFVGRLQYSYQCAIFDLGDGSTMCSIQTVGYNEEENFIAAQKLDRLNLLGHNSRKHSQKILDRL